MGSFFSQSVILLWYGLGYCIGAIPTGYFLTKIFCKKDLRDVGSGTTGASNAGRVMGWLGFFGVFLIDSFKAYFYIMLVDVYCAEISIVIVGIMLVLGNGFSLLPRWPHGKGVATTLGVLFFLQPVLGFCFVFMWAMIFLLLRFPTASSLISFLFLLFMIFFVGSREEVKLFLIVIAPLLVYTHRIMIRKILSDEPLRWYLKRLQNYLMAFKK